MLTAVLSIASSNQTISGQMVHVSGGCMLTAVLSIVSSNKTISGQMVHVSGHNYFRISTHYIHIFSFVLIPAYSCGYVYLFCL